MSIRTCLITICAGALLAGCGSAGSPTAARYEVDAIFDTAKGVLPGVPVTVAGTEVGTVEGIALTPAYEARVRMVVDGRFGPFRSDATCQVRPQGVIGESFVDCKPGTPSAPPLQAGPAGAPVVELEQTSVPVELTDFFDIWKVPVRQRLTLLLNELGAGLAGRGEDLNELLRRANPALRKANEVLAVLDDQRDDLREGITASNTVLAELAGRRDGLRTVVREAGETFDLTASRTGALREGIRTLPPLLREVRPSLDQLDELSLAAAPVLGDFRRAGPRLESLLGEVEGFSDEAVPAIRKLSPTVSLGHRALRDGAPFADRLKDFSRGAEPTGRLLNELLVSARDDGALEGLQRLAYNYATIASRFDAKGHLFPTAILVNGCSQTVVKEDPKCSARYSQIQGDELKADRPKDRPSRRSRPTQGSEPDEPREDEVRPVPEAAQKAANEPATPPASAPPRDARSTPSPDQPAQGLLDFLLR